MLRFDRPLAVAVLFLMTVASAHAQVSDHLKCYQIKDQLTLAGTADLNTPQFGLDPGCKISKTTFFCVPSTKTNVAVIDKSTGIPITPQDIPGPDPGDRICYKVKCPKPVVPIPNQVVTDQFGTRTVTKFKASILCGPAVEGTPVPTPTPMVTPTSTPNGPRFIDNGDGTVMDSRTGLQWEKKDNLDGIRNPADPHDADNTYVWSNSGAAPDGPAFTDFLGKLNNCTSSDGTAVTNAGFAGHCDWRLPTIQELQTIVDATRGNCGGGSGPCIDPIFGPTVFYPGYWSVTTISGPDVAFYVYFDTGVVGAGLTYSNLYVRAVRAGS